MNLEIGGGGVRISTFSNRIPKSEGSHIWRIVFEDDVNNLTIKMHDVLGPKHLFLSYLFAKSFQKKKIDILTCTIDLSSMQSKNS